MSLQAAVSRHELRQGSDVIYEWHKLRKKCARFLQLCYEVAQLSSSMTAASRGKQGLVSRPGAFRVMRLMLKVGALTRHGRPGLLHQTRCC